MSSNTRLPAPKDEKNENAPVDENDEEEIICVEKWNQSDLKNACDDYIQKYLTKKAHYSQYHTHTDVKLVLGYLSCVFALGGGGYTYYIPFEESKQLTLVCVAAYPFCVDEVKEKKDVLALHAIIIERDIIFVGVPSEGEKTHKLTIHTHTKRYSDIYYITFESSTNTTHSTQSSSTATAQLVGNVKYTIEKSFGAWFDEHGALDIEKFGECIEQGLKFVRSGGKPHEE
ncbi:8601_t:CDS:2 [Paraglomus brasilianum]|uniref:Signal peptidase complex subunit 2 n=1 Tax=Paraglomus brasilianum TaxID=144538 RepID=A0A9N9GDX2_9GLOM|nr:8601_t:CDS:2 [Paraglomus brasilianum]